MNRPLSVVLSAVIALPIAAALNGCSASAEDEGADIAGDELVRGTAPAAAKLQGKWSDYGVALDDHGRGYKQSLMDLELKSNGHFEATLPTTCADDGRGLCGNATSGTYTYAASKGVGHLELTFDAGGPKNPYVFSDVRVTQAGVLEFYRDSQFSGGGKFLANRLVPAIVRATCGGCQDVYTDCVADGTSAKSCRDKFNQCNFNSSYKSFALAQADCYPREATKDICDRAQSWVKDNEWRADLKKDALAYSREILAYYKMSETDCPLGK